MRCSTEAARTDAAQRIAMETLVSWLLFKHCGTHIAHNKHLTPRERAAQLILLGADVQRERIAAIIAAVAGIDLVQALHEVDEALKTLWEEAL